MKNKYITQKPNYLKKGDCIGIVCPAGFMPLKNAETCIKTLQNWGYKVKVGNTLGNEFHYFSGTDDERRIDLQAMLDDANIKAILFGRGGYGVGRIIDELDFSLFKKNPKWLIGFSDITILHTHIKSNFKIASLHAPMAAAFNKGGYKNQYVLSLQKALKGLKSNYTCKPHVLNKIGMVEGELIGGNLTLLAHVLGTKSEYKTKNKILFIEDVGEYIYNVDRMLYQLKRSGKLKNLAGLIVGGFTDMKDTVTPFGKKVYQVIQDIVAESQYPVCYNFPVSHSKENVALKVGVVHQLNISSKKVTLKEV